jgi:uncharacterized protein GlcG (DUF336 family)
VGSSMLERALTSVEAGLAYADELGVRVAIVVLDTSFTPVVAVRADGAYESAFKVAVAKAHTALNFRSPTDDLKSRIAPENQAALGRLEPLLLFVGGGRPLRDEEGIIGSVGVSGASEAQDAECASVVAQKFES